MILMKKYKNYMNTNLAFLLVNIISWLSSGTTSDSTNGGCNRSKFDQLTNRTQYKRTCQKILPSRNRLSRYIYVCFLASSIHIPSSPKHRVKSDKDTKHESNSREVTHYQ